MIKIDDIVKINIDELELGDFTDQKMLDYIYEHPDQEYRVKQFDAYCAAQVILDDPVLCATSFFESELILVGGETR